MADKTTATTNQAQAQQSQTNPWAPTQPDLTSILGILGGQIPSLASASPYQQKALQALKTNATNLPNFGPQATGAVNGLFGSIPQMLQSNQDVVKNALMPQLSANFTDPFSNPATRQLLDTINTDVSKSVNDMFAGSGRDLSGMNTQTVARGIAQGEAPTLFNEYNTLLGQQTNAANTLSGTGVNTAGAVGGAYNNAAGLASAVPGLTNAPQMAQLEAALMKKNLPIAGLGSAAGLLLPIAGLGGQSSGSGTSNGQFTPSTFQDMMQIAGLFGGTNPAASNILNIGGKGIGMLGSILGA